MGKRVPDPNSRKLKGGVATEGTSDERREGRRCLGVLTSDIGVRTSDFGLGCWPRTSPLVARGIRTGTFAARLTVARPRARIVAPQRGTSESQVRSPLSDVRRQRRERSDAKATQHPTY